MLSMIVFASQHSLVYTNSALPPVDFITDLRLDSVIFDKVKILASIRVLNLNNGIGKYFFFLQDRQRHGTSIFVEFPSTSKRPKS